ncbi:hypothetical protein D3C72_1920220 [compost metagenome]
MKLSLKAWISYHAEPLGVAVSFAFGAATILTVFALIIPTGPSARETGIVTGFGLRESETGSYRVMHIAVGSAKDTITAPSHLDCRVGDSVEVTRVKQWWGYRHAIGVAETKPCSRPSFRN